MTQCATPEATKQISNYNENNYNRNRSRALRALYRAVCSPEPGTISGHKFSSCAPDNWGPRTSESCPNARIIFSPRHERACTRQTYTQEFVFLPEPFLLFFFSFSGFIYLLLASRNDVPPAYTRREDIEPPGVVVAVRLIATLRSARALPRVFCVPCGRIGLFSSGAWEFRVWSCIVTS